MTSDFTGLIGEQLAGALLKQGIMSPTEIQMRAIPHILAGKDVIAQSETGSGKTLAYLLPIFKSIDVSLQKPQAVIVTPTRELAAQVRHVAAELSESVGSPVEPALIIGGASISRQLEALKRKPRIIIGSAGRILELVKMKKLSMHNVRTIVIDEADKMLDEDNINMVTSLVKHTLADRQVLMFSATVTEKAEITASGIMKQPELVRVNSLMPSNITHMLFTAERREKIKLLRKIIHSEGISKGLVFLNNPNGIEDMSARLNYHGIKSEMLFGGALKNERRLALEGLRDGRFTVLVASDIAARGLDIKDLTHVINLDIPENPGDYLHRAGRAGRGGQTGTVITIATEFERNNLKKYEKALGITITEKDMAFGKIINTQAVE